MAFDLNLALNLFVGVGIGALIGMEREQSEPDARFAGSRTMPLVALLGGLTQTFYPNMLLAVFILIFILILVANSLKQLKTDDLGMTTAIAAILVFTFGAMAAHSENGMFVAIVFGGLTTVVLASKKPMHGLARRIDSNDRVALVKFLIVVMIVFPLLPNERVDWLLGLNPRFVWMMVVFVSGIEIASYLLVQLLGDRKGLGASGLLGGLVSSTATTSAMARQTRDEPRLLWAAAFAVGAATLSVWPRVLLEIGVVAPGLIMKALWPVIAMGIVTLGFSAWFYRKGKEEAPERPSSTRTPFHLTSALLFGFVFALVLLAVRYAGEHLGDVGVYVSAFLAGMVSVNASTLALARAASEGTVSDLLAVRGILVGIASNLLAKSLLAYWFGTRRLGTAVLLLNASVFIVGIAVTLLL